MSKVYLEDSVLTDIADAIREKTGESEPITPADMATEIENISGGGVEFPDVMENISRLNIENRFQGLLPKKITFIHQNPYDSRFSLSEFQDKILEVSLNAETKELIIDISQFSRMQTNAETGFTCKRLFHDETIPAGTISLPKVTINNPNNIRNFGNTVAAYSYTNTPRDALFVFSFTTIVSLELKDVEFLKQWYGLLGYKEGVIKKWSCYIDYSTFIPKIIGIAKVSNPQVLLDNFQFDTMRSSASESSLSYHNIVLFYFWKWVPNSTFYNVHIDRGDYTTADKRLFYMEPSKGVAYNVFCRHLSADDFTWETDENNQPLVLTNIANQTLPLVNMSYSDMLTWTLNGIKNFLRTLPDTSQGEGNNTIQCANLSTYSGSTDWLLYLKDMPTEDIASLTSRGWTLSIS